MPWKRLDWKPGGLAESCSETVVFICPLWKKEFDPNPCEFLMASLVSALMEVSMASIKFKMACQIPYLSAEQRKYRREFPGFSSPVFCYHGLHILEFI